MLNFICSLITFKRKISIYTLLIY